MACGGDLPDGGQDDEVAVGGDLLLAAHRLAQDGRGRARRCRPRGGRIRHRATGARRAFGGARAEPPAPNTARPACVAACSTRASRSGRRPASPMLAQPRSANAAMSSGSRGQRPHVEHERRVAEEIRRVRDLIEQQRKEVGVVRDEQPQGQDSLQRATDLERYLARLVRGPRRANVPARPPRAARAPGQAGACGSWVRCDHTMLWFGAFIRACGGCGITSAFRENRKRPRAVQAGLPLRPGLRARGGRWPACVRSWATARAGAGTGQS